MYHLHAVVLAAPRRFSSPMRSLLPFFIPLTLCAQQPAAHWSFDGADTAARLRESYGRHALDASEAGGASSWVARSGFGDTLANGSNTPYVSVANQAALSPGSGDFSISLWSYRTSDDSNAAGLLDALNGTGTGYQWFYQANGTLRVRLDDHLGNTVNVDTATSQLVLNSWRHLVLTIDRTNARARIYANGSEVTAAGGVSISTLTGNIVPDQGLWIGTLNGSTAAKGRIDDVAMFPRLLSAADISALNAGGGVPALSQWPPAAPLPAVTITPKGGLIRGAETISLSAGSGAVIRYTLDGSDPSPQSALYTAPISLAASATLRARVFDGESAGEITTASFAKVPAERPNVVLLVASKIGAGDLSCYGAVSTFTPRLDRLAAEGMRFAGLCAVGPGETSSPYALLTGRVSRRGMLADQIAPNQAGLDRREWTLAESFRKSGYHTAFIGAWELGSALGSRPSDQGFTLFHGLPWSPGQTPAPSLCENDTVLGPIPTDLGGALASRAENYLSSRGEDPFLLVLQVPALPATGDSQLGSTGNRIEAFDQVAGRVLDRLDLLGLEDETLVIFLSESTADRSAAGPSIGSNAQFRDGEGSTWDGGLRLPAIARWPGVIPASSTNLAALWLPDLCPSLVALAQGWQPQDRPYDGATRAEILLGAQLRTAEDAKIFHHRRNGSAPLIPAMREGPWKLHLSTNSTDPQNPAPGTAPLLYQTEVDPSERINLASAQAARVTQMQAAIAAHDASFAAAQLPPAQPPLIGEPVSTISAAGGARLTYRRPTASLNDRYLIEFSGDLITWAPEPSLPWVESVIRHEDATETVTVNVPPNHPRLSGSRVFLRLRADYP